MAKLVSVSVENNTVHLQRRVSVPLFVVLDWCVFCNALDIISLKKLEWDLFLFCLGCRFHIFLSVLPEELLLFCSSFV